MEPTPGGQLAELYEGMSDPLLSIVARLAKGPIGVPDETASLSTLVEANFPGYAPIPLAVDLENAIDGEGYGELSPQRIQFVVGTLTQPQLLTHLYFTKTYNGAGASLVSVIPFTEPVLVVESNTTIEFDVNVAGFLDSAA